MNHTTHQPDTNGRTDPSDPPARRDTLARTLRRAACGLFALALVGCPIAPPETAYFLVSDPGGPHGDSYVLPLSAPTDIAHARALIADPENTDAHIVVARIAAGPGDPENRNITGDGKAWSWHVTEFVNFTDFTIEIYDGWPTYVEENFDAWMEITGGYIGFWDYTVTEELELVPN